MLYGKDPLQIAVDFSSKFNAVQVSLTNELTY